MEIRINDSRWSKILRKQFIIIIATYHEKLFFLSFQITNLKKKIKKFKLRLMQRDAGCKLYAIGLFICGKIYRKNMSFKILNQNLKKNKELKI